MFVRPAEGRKVRRPRTLTLLPESGAEVPADSFWLRRLAHGDVVEVDPPAEATAAHEPDTETGAGA